MQAVLSLRVRNSEFASSCKLVWIILAHTFLLSLLPLLYRIQNPFNLLLFIDQALLELHLLGLLNLPVPLQLPHQLLLQLLHLPNHVLPLLDVLTRD